MSVAASNPAALQQVEFDSWKPVAGDVFIADTRVNMGYLVHEDGTFAATRIGSGQRRVVHYMKRTYNAATPSDHWIVGEIDVQSDRLTFGKDGTFMRLFRDGTEYTSYGIHSVANIDDLLATDQRYYSMGCILVNDELLAVLLDTYRLNGDTLDVLTVDGLSAFKTPAQAPMSAMK